MPRSERTPRYRSTALDRALAPARTVVAVGPVADLDEEAMRSVLRTAQNSSATPRLALAPRTDTRIWTYADDLERHVITRDDLDTSNLGQLVTEIRKNVPTESALQVVICGDYVVVNYSHGVADGQLGVTLPALLTTGDTTRAAAMARGLDRTAVWNALWRHYRANPGAIKQFWQLRRQHKTPSDVGMQRRIRDWRDSTVSFSGYLDPTRLAQLRTWAKARWPGATSASITVAMWLAALREEGAAVDDKVMILMNCRRYLDPGCAAVQGNFAVGIPLRLPGCPSPESVAEVTRQVIESGWPAAILGMSEVKARIPGRSDPTGDEPPDGVSVGERIRAAVSDVGRLRMYEPHPWAAGNRPPQLSAYLEPDGPDAVPLLVAELAGGQTFTASYCTQMVEPGVIEKAVCRMCSDPIGLLEAIGAQE